VIALQILALLAANGVVALGAHELVRRIGTGRASMDITLFVLVRLLLISSIVLTLGLLGRLDWVTAGILATVALAGLGASGAFRRLPAPAWPAWPAALRYFLALVSARLLVQALVFSPYHSDVISYMLPKVAIWVQTGAISTVVGADPRAWFPSGFELVEAWWVLFLRHDVFIELAGIEFLALGFAATYSLAEDLNCSARAAAIASTCFILVTGIHFQATGCTNDGPMSMVVVATVALIRSKVAPALVAAAMFLGIGIKPTYGYALPGLLVLYAVFRRGRMLGSHPAWPEFALVLSALCVGTFWYVRNAALWGNPIYPMGAGGVHLGGPTLQRLGPSLPVLAANVKDILDLRIYDYMRAPDLTCNFMLNWGSATFALGLPGAILWARSDREFRWVAIGLLISAAAVLCQVMSDACYTRFILFLSVVPALAVGRLCEHHRAAAVALPVVLVLQFASTLVPDELWDSQLRSALRGRPIFEEQPFPEVGCYASSEAGDYLLYRRDFSARVAYLNAESLDGLLWEMERERVEVFYTGRLTPARAQVVREGVVTGRLVPLSGSQREGYRRGR
jgi:hypothetical protein